MQTLQMKGYLIESSKYMAGFQLVGKIWLQPEPNFAK